MAGRCPGSGLPARRRRCRHLFAPLPPGSQRGSDRPNLAQEPPGTPPSPGQDCRRGGRARARRGLRSGAGSAVAPPPPLLPRLPEGWAGAGAGPGVAEAGARAGGQRPRLAAGPTLPRPPCLRHPPSPRFCEVVLTWQSLRGGRAARPWATSPAPGSPLRDLKERAAPRSSSSHPGSPGGRPSAGPIRRPQALAELPAERRGRKRPGPARGGLGPGPGPRHRVQSRPGPAPACTGACQVLCF